MLAEVVETNINKVGGVNSSHGVNERLAGISASINRKYLCCSFRVTNNVAFYKIHNIKRCFTDSGVGAKPECRSNGNIALAECCNNFVFAAHVVSAREHVAKWRAAQYVPFTVCVGDAKGEIRVSTRNHLEMKGSGDAINICGKPSDNFRGEPSGQFISHAL